MANILTKLLTMGEGRQLRKYDARVEAINALEPSMLALSDAELAGKTEQDALIAYLQVLGTTIKSKR